MYFIQMSQLKRLRLKYKKILVFIQVKEIAENGVNMKQKFFWICTDEILLK